MADFKTEVEQVFGRQVFKFLKVVAVLIGFYIVVALIFGIFPFSVVTSVVKSVVNERQIIGNYQWFYDQYNAIQAQQANYEAMSADAYERNGMRIILNNAIAEYNSRSKQITKNFNTNIFLKKNKLFRKLKMQPMAKQ